MRYVILDGMPTTRFRRDVQGLRAIAVLAVVVEHTAGAPVGGWLGVDVFFVVSGFLITGGLLRQLRDDGSVRLTTFWWRRLWRLAPAFLLVTAVTLALSAWLTPGAFRADATAAAASLVSVSNWYFARIGTDYFAALGPTSAFRHTWSLGVEEQFYAVWPLVVALVAVAVRSRRGVRSVRAVLTTLLVVVVATSLLSAWSSSATDPSVAYFSTTTRAWEIGAGAIVACTTDGRRVPARVARVLWSVGVVVVVVGLVSVTAAVPAPAPAGLLPVLGTCAVLVGGTVRGAGLPVLENRVTDGIGAISYVLYLWHFPVLVFLTVLAPSATWTSIPIALLLALATHRLVEEPLRYGLRQRVRARPRPPQRSLAYASAAAAVALAVGVVAVRPVPEPVQLGPVTASGAVRAVQEHLGTALAATTWSGLPRDLQAQEDSHTLPRACGSIVDRPAIEDCTFGPATAPHTLVVAGDSLAATWLDALVPWAAEHLPGWRLVAVPTDGCPAIDLPLRGLRPQCASASASALRTIQELRPDVVLLTSKLEDPFGLDGTLRAATEHEFADGTERFAETLRSSTGRLVHLLPPPGGADLRTCRSPFGTPLACVTRTSASWRERAATIHAMAARHGDGVVDSSPLVARDGLTTAVVDGVPVRSDRVHLSRDYAGSVRDALGQLLQQGVPQLR